MRITVAHLQRALVAPNTPAAEDALGDLAPWLLATVPPPAVPVDVGSFLVFMAWVDPPGGPLLPSFALPLCWVAGAKDDPALPPALLSVAYQVHSQVAPMDTWGLQRHASIQRCDLSELRCSADSAWAALATSLVLTRGGLRPKPEIGLTGAWFPQGLVAVTHLEQKLSAAKRLGLRTLFAPATAMTGEGSGITVSTLPTGLPRWRDSLAPALETLAVPPAPDAPLASRWAYADLLPSDVKNRYLITSGTAQAHGHMLAPDEGPVGTLVAILSNAGAVTAATALKAKRTIFVHTSRDQVLAELASHAIGAESLQIDRDDDDGLARFVSACQPDVLDVQGGTKRMALVATLAAPQAGIVVLDGTHDGDHHRSGSEHLVWVRKPSASTDSARPAAPLPKPSAKTPLPMPSLTHRKVTWRLRMTAGTKLPRWKGSLVRGIIGHGLLDSAAGAPAPAWPGLQPGTSFVKAVFSPHEAWKDTRATHAWSLQVLDEREDLAPDDIIEGTIILHGHWEGWAEDLFAEALSVGALHGLGGRRIPAKLTSWEVVDLPAMDSKPPAAACRLTLHTPASLKIQGVDCEHLTAPVIAQGLLRRLNRLHIQTMGREWLAGAEYANASHICELLEGTGSSTQYPTARWSNRQRCQVTMPALIGDVIVSGSSLATCWPWLAWAPYLNVGRRAQLGMGVCSWTVADPDRQEATL